MVRLAVKEGTQGLHGGGDLFRWVPFLLELVLDGVGDPQLVLIGGVYSTSVLSTHIGALRVDRCRIVDAEEEVHQLFIGDVGWLIGNENGFGKIRLTSTHLLVVRVHDVCLAVGITDTNFH